MPATYPKRPQLFALRFVRVLYRSCAAQEVGPEGVALLVAIAQVEDSKRYTDAVTFWNDQLLPIVGFRNWAALDRVRKICIEAGWLHYEPGGKGRIGRYWVTIPERLEVLDNSPLGVNHGDIPTGSIVESEDHSVRETGSKPDQYGTECGSKPDGPREHSSLSLDLTLPRSSSPRSVAPTPDEQDITTPSVPRSDVPRGTENDTPANPELEARTLGVWVRWRSSDASRQAENLATLTDLIRKHGAKRVQAVAERIQREGAPERSRAPGEKCWVDELLPAILASQGGSEAPGGTTAPNPPATPKPAIVAQAHALLAAHGAAACRTALGWPSTTASTDQAMRTALEREELAADLVDAFAHGPLVVTNP